MRVGQCAFHSWNQRGSCINFQDAAELTCTGGAPVYVILGSNLEMILQNQILYPS